MQQQQQQRPYTIGLTGGIASGKSSIASVLQKQCRAVVIDADALGHHVQQPGQHAHTAIVAEFGAGVLQDGDSGEINRRRLGDIVFADKLQMAKLTAIMWPAIRAEVAARLASAAAAGARVCVVEAAVLLEAGWEADVDELWVLVVPETVSQQRLVERNGLTTEQAQARIAAQMSVQERVAEARRRLGQHRVFTLDTQCTKDAMAVAAQQLYDAAEQRAASAPASDAGGGGASNPDCCAGSCHG